MQKLAEGSAEDVFLGRLEGQGSNVIVEVMRSEVGADQETVARFLERAKVHQQLAHPHLARRVESGRTGDGLPYFVSEPFSGESLAAFLSRHGPLELPRALRLFLPLCEAVAYLHQRKLVHGNLKPANVFLVDGIEAYNPRLFDSGLALFRLERRAAKGTPRPLVESEYLSPERVRGHRAIPASDLYALGVLFHEVLTGEPPFRAKFPEQTRKLHLEAPLPALPPNAQALTEVLHRCLAKEPTHRFESAGALLAALERVQAPRTSAPHRLEIPPAEQGEIFGSYKILKLLGQGAMGRVFLARHTRLDRLMAIKLLKTEHARSRQFVERFFQEARAANQINHEHIVEIVDFVEETSPNGDPRVYCVMEYLEGESLEALLRHEPISIGRAVRILRQLCQALEAAHKVGVIHRDVKPDNIFLTERAGERDYVKVLDFGVAKIRRPGDGLQETQIVGTPAYMAPEQAAGEQPDARTDVYAVGCVLYRVLSGTVPFRAGSFMQLLAQLTSAAPAPLPRHTLRGELVPETLGKIVMRCLEKRREDRPQSMAVLSELLRPYEGSALPALPRDEPGLEESALFESVDLSFGLSSSIPVAPPSAVVPLDPRTLNLPPGVGPPLTLVRQGLQAPAMTAPLPRPRPARRPGVDPLWLALVAAALLAVAGAVRVWRSFQVAPPPAAPKLQTAPALPMPPPPAPARGKRGR